MFESEKIIDILNRKNFTVSVEIFPPRNGRSPEIILRKIDALKDLGLDFASITKGAMGSMRGGTVPIGYMISERYGMNSLVHFRCRDLNRRDVENLLVDHNYFGIKNILAVLGDPVIGEGECNLDPGQHNIYASELVSQIRKMNHGEYLPLPDSDIPREGIKTDFCIGVACYPEAEDMEKELMVMEQKVGNGADFAISQMVFDADVYSNYVAKLRERGIEIPVIPGVRPVASIEHVTAAEEIFCANVPDILKRSLLGLSPEGAREVCIEFSTDLCRQLRERGAPGIRLFTLNDVDIESEIVKNI